MYAYTVCPSINSESFNENGQDFLDSRYPRILIQRILYRDSYDPYDLRKKFISFGRPLYIFQILCFLSMKSWTQYNVQHLRQCHSNRAFCAEFTV